MSSGFTLLEIVVALAIVALILGVVVSRMDTMLEWDMKKASNKLATTIRYLYNKSATEGLYIRLVLDIDENSYWVEATTDQFALSSGEGEKKKSGAEKKNAEKKTEGEKPGAAEAPAAEEAAKEKGAAPGGAAEPLKAKEPVFTQVEEFLLKPTKLPDTVFFKDVYVEHEQNAVAGGKAMIHFFPNGYVEHAVINLRDEGDERNYSLETNPVSGQVSIDDKYRTMGKD
ncbi:MAG: type II secretion system protein [bacterium]